MHPAEWAKAQVLMSIRFYQEVFMVVAVLCQSSCKLVSIKDSWDEIGVTNKCLKSLGFNFLYLLVCKEFIPARPCSIASDEPQAQEYLLTNTTGPVYTRFP